MITSAGSFVRAEASRWNSMVPAITSTYWLSFDPIGLFPDVLRDLKSNSSGWMHDIFPSLRDFCWQRGYGAFTVGQAEVNSVRDYIRRQKEHHCRISFREEFIQFLDANGIEYDERFI